MEHTNRFSLIQLPRLHPMRNYMRRLAIDGKPTSTVLMGDEISIQYFADDFFLVATNYDYFDAVSNWFYLIDNSNAIRDKISIPDYLGFVRDVSVLSSSTMSFGVFGTNDIWTLVIRPKGFWSYKFFDLSRRINRFIFKKRYLQIECVKGQPWRLEESKGTN